MQEEIGQVMSRRVESIQLAVQHVGDGSKWDPVSAVIVSEGPGDPLPGQPALDLGIVVDTEIVIKDAALETIRTPTTEVKTVRPQATSTMPEGLLGNLEPQQAADLLEWLSTLK